MLNGDLGQRVVIDTQREKWFEAKNGGVWTLPLADEDDHIGRRTGLIRCDPGATPTSHDLMGVSEIFVLEGTISVMSNDYRAGTYIPNSETLARSWHSEHGCTLFVRKHQSNPGEVSASNIDTNDAWWLDGYGNLKVMPLHNYGTESTALVYWPAGEHFIPHAHDGGEEILVINGEFIDEHGRYPPLTWIRSPHMSRHDPYVEVDTTILVKVGHLLP